MSVKLALPSMAILATSLFAPSAYATNCVPDSSVTFTAANDASGNTHLYWIDTNSLHVCYAIDSGQQLGSGGLAFSDLTQARGLPIAASPIASAVNTPQGVNLFYVDQNSYMVFLNNESSGTELTGLGKIAVWTAVHAVYNPTNTVRSVTYGVDADSSPDNYGVRKAVYRYDYNFNAGTSAGTNLYSAYGRSIEHLETQVNSILDSNGRVYSTFDPEGQGHIHYISSVPGVNSNYQHQDLMDDTSVGGVNVVTGGGIVAPNNPTCQASGIAETTLNGVPRFAFIGKDGDLHLLSGTNTSWGKNDLTHDSGGILPTGCGKLAAVAVSTSTEIIAYQSGQYLAYVRRVNGASTYVNAAGALITTSPLALAPVGINGQARVYYVINQNINGIQSTPLVRGVIA